MIELKDFQHFSRTVLTGSGIALVKFWGPACPPCVELTRVLDSVEVLYQSSVDFYSANAEQLVNVADDCGVRGIPTLVVFENGKVTERWVGNISRKEIQKRLDRLIG